ncbi:MAG: LacI family DNA-binding transcriptional regulator, partial [Ileibacterium sp.]|nr:LacI family DNA-binding transcriptional regulator [Ileibacterium sp.]
MNIYDISKQSGVSIATVSRAMNNSGYVSAKTKAKIMKVIEENNYSPSAFARGMST